MSLTPTSDHPRLEPSDPRPPEIHPLLALSLAVSLATGTGLLTGWSEAVTVLVSCLGVLAGRPRRNN
ncbi:Uncharacterised protein [Nocardia africana]|uniref:Uncharacterized protein n=1 Tax=Nocardia africana TaxID=134964 RepID=A0A378X1V3_9NOCA|nr:Uncharacterised protein [Nocardia africana]